MPDQLSITRHDTLQEFTCDRCGRPKKSKLLGTWVTGSLKRRICNGCYGYLRSVS